jgi:hypothetical protein
MDRCVYCSDEGYYKDGMCEYCCEFVNELEEWEEYFIKELDEIERVQPVDS